MQSEKSEEMILKSNLKNSNLNQSKPIARKVKKIIKLRCKRIIVGSGPALGKLRYLYLIKL